MVIIVNHENENIENGSFYAKFLFYFPLHILRSLISVEVPYFETSSDKPSLVFMGPNAYILELIKT